MITYEKEISIIIPHYNTPRLLEKLLDSIPDNDEIEVIVVDDRSNEQLDEYKACIKKFANRNICFLDNNLSAKGAGVCRNIGMKQAVGKWLLFADADDFFMDDFYEKLKAFLDSDSEIIYFIPTSIELPTGKQGIRHVEREETIKKYIYESNKKNELDLRYCFVEPWSKLIKHQLVYDNNIFFDEIMFSNDGMFSIKSAFFAKKIAASEDVIYCITRSKGSLTTQNCYDNFLIRLNVFIRRYNFLKEHLSNQEFTLLNIHGRGYIWRAISNGYSLQEIVQVYSILRSNKVRLLNKDVFNVLLMIKHLRKFIYTVEREKIYESFEKT